METEETEATTGLAVTEEEATEAVETTAGVVAATTTVTAKDGGETRMRS